MKMQTALNLILRVIDLVVEGIGMATKAKAKYVSIRQSIQIFIDEGRDPTPEEWAALDVKIMDNSDRIQNS